MSTQQEYYNTPSQYGNYQFTTLKDVIDEMLLEARLGGDNYIQHTNRALFILHGKSGLKELTKSTSRATLAVELTVDNSGCVIMPMDYVDYVRISVVVVDANDGSRRLQTLDVTNNMNTATGYLQDHNGNLLFDNNGDVLKADSNNVYNSPYKSFEFVQTLSGQPMLDTSKLTASGEFGIDEENGIINFGANLINQDVVIEYESDGLQWESFGEGEIKVHKYIEQALKDWIYFACIERRILVPANEKARALARYKTTKHQAKKNRANLDMNQIAREMRIKTKHL